MRAIQTLSRRVSCTSRSATNFPSWLNVPAASKGRFFSTSPLPVEEEEEDDEKTRSIAEAIAAYKAEESLRIAEKLEQARKEGEQAALARAEQDLILAQRKKAFEEWQRNLEAAKKKEQEEKEAELASEQGPVHPVLGAVVSDFGYKRLHVVPSSVLENVPVWEKQRIFRYDRSKEMAADKMQTLHLGLPGVICLYEDANGQLSVLDGQHRIGMMKILAEKKTEGIDLDRVLVEVYPAPPDGNEEESLEYASEIFAEINKAEPVKSVDIFANKGDRKILVGGVEALKERYPDMFSPSLRCRPPNVNVDNLRDGIFANNILKDKGIKSPKALYDWLLQQNEALKKIYTDSTEHFPVKVNEKALQKANRHGFYLGIDPTYGWLSKGN